MGTKLQRCENDAARRNFTHSIEFCVVARVALITLFLLVCRPANSQITLRAGQSYTYRFASLNFRVNTTFGVAEPSGALFLSLEPSAPGQLGPNDAYKVELFEGSPDEQAKLTRTITRASSI